MIQFIRSTHGKEANRLLQSVLADLLNSVNLAGCRGLGLIDKVVTGPLWRKLVESSTSVFQMSAVYTTMKAKFDMWSLNSCSVLEGSGFIEECSCVCKDEVWDALIDSNEAGDVLTQELLQLLFGAFSTITQRLLMDHLQGGEYHAVTDTVIVEETASVPTTNVAPERDFAVLDRMVREKPNAHVIALESMILYSHNKTSAWLEQKTHQEREVLLKAARTLAPGIHDKFRRRRQEIERRREEALIEKQRIIAQREMKNLQEKEKLTKEIGTVGLWISRADVENGLLSLSNKGEKTKILKLQINFRRKVLSQSHSDTSVFKFSQNKKQHSVDRLKQNLFQLLTNELVSDESATQVLPLQGHEKFLMEPDLLVGERVRHRFDVDGEMLWFEGTVLKMNASREFQVI